MQKYDTLLIDMDIYSLFDLTVERIASDLHLIPGYFPTIRINNDLFPIRTSPVLTGDDIKNLLLTILSEEQKENLFANKEIDFGYEYKNNRFRINAYYTKGSIAAAIRLIGQEIKTADQLQLPAVVHDFAKYSQGLVLVTGPTGEGKTTTLAAIINEINVNSSKHVITIEDPIEYVYPAGKSIVSQRELHQDTHSWNVALKSVLREDPDIVLIGEMRDYETIQLALTIAETGHLVFSTLHTSTSPETINRIIDVFPSVQQNQIRMQLASVLKAVVSQRLLPTADGNGRIPCLEVLLNIPSVSSVIRDGRTHLLDNILETNEEYGLFLFEKYLASLFNRGIITKETAFTYALRPNELNKFIR